MTWTKYGNPNSSNNVTGLIDYANSVSNYLVFDAMLICMFIVVFSSAYALLFDVKKAFLYAAFSTSIPAIILGAIGYMPVAHTIVYAVVFLASLIIAWNK